MAQHSLKGNFLNENESEVDSTSTTDEPIQSDVESAEIINEDKTDEHVPLYDEEQNFPHMEENDDGFESSLEFIKSQKEHFLTQAIKNATILSNDLSVVEDKISKIFAKSQTIEYELKIKKIQYRSIEIKADCLNLFLDSKLKMIEDIPEKEIHQFTDDEIEKLLSS